MGTEDSTMITAIVKAQIIEGMNSEIRRVAEILQNEYSCIEPGCIQYESYIDGNQFITVERWLDQQHLDQHLETKHVKEYVPQLRACVVNGVFNVVFIESDNVKAVTI